MRGQITTSQLVLDNPVAVGDQFFYQGRDWVVAHTERVGTGHLIAAAVCEYCSKGFRVARNTRYRIFRCMEEYYV